MIRVVTAKRMKVNKIDYCKADVVNRKFIPQNHVKHIRMSGLRFLAGWRPTEQMGVQQWGWTEIKLHM